MEINSLQNPQIKNIIKLKKASERKKQGFFVVEGEREIKIAIKSGLILVNHYICEKFNKNKEGLYINNSILVSSDVFQKMSNRESPDGNIAVFKEDQKEIKNLSFKEKPLFIILDSIEKPGNLGAIARTADAAGVDAIFLTKPNLDIYNPNAIRASQGTIFSTPIYVIKREELLQFCKNNSINIVATSPRAKKDYIKQDFRGSVAILMGSEDCGLDDEWLRLANEMVKIEMRGKIDSLNLSVSTAIILFEALRQRK